LQLQDALAHIEIVAEEKMTALAETRAFKDENEKLKLEVSQISDRLRQ